MLNQDRCRRCVNEIVLFHAVTFMSVLSFTLAPQFCARAVNHIQVETVTVPPGSVSQSVGIRIDNDVPLQMLVFPLIIREIDPGAFITNHLAISSSGRLAATEANGAWTLKQLYNVSGIYVGRHSCPVDSFGNTWATADSALNYVSPEAMIYVFVQNNDTTRFESGSDSGFGVPPSLVVGFDVGYARGAFEIDSTCIPPSNNLLWMEAEPTSTLLTPTFEKGVIDIGGPFWDSDSISGHISSDLILRRNVFVSGDLTVDAGVTLTLLRGADIEVKSFGDAEHSGVDTGRVEIIVNGTLAVDDALGLRPRLHADTALRGAWYGIRVMPGGRFETGIGAVIDDAVVGLRIDKGAVTDTLSGLTIQNCDSIGISNGGINVVLIQDSVIGIPFGIGIFVDSGGPLIQECYVDSCGTGISTYKSWSTIRETNVVGPGTCGIKIDNNPIIIIEGGGRGPRVPVEMAAEGQSYIVTLFHDTVSGYFSDGQLWMGNSSSICSVDSCGFVHPTGSQRSPYGLNLGSKDTVTVRRSLITGFTTAGVNSVGSKANLGVNPSSLGNNYISTDSAGCSGCLLRRVKHTGLDTLKSEGNWWGAASPSSAWFNGKVDWNPYLTAPAGKVSAPEDREDLALGVPRQHSVEQNYPNPFNSTTEIEFALASNETVSLKVYNILGQVVKTLAEREFSEGTHRVIWDGITDDGVIAASGIYLYRMVAGGYAQSKKMVLLK